MSDKTMVYAVFKEAVYRHECGGIFTNADDAVAAAELLRDGEPDGHHCYTVVPFYLDEMTEQIPLKKSVTGIINGGHLVELPEHANVGHKR